jgi:hypothetical protein
LILIEKIIFLNYYFSDLNMAALWNSEIAVVTNVVLYKILILPFCSAWFTYNITLFLASIGAIELQ